MFEIVQLHITYQQDGVKEASRDLETRMMVHKEEKLACTKCDKLFVNNDTLKRHVLQQHAGHFKFFCDKCKKGFADVTNYKAHMRIHEGLKFNCDYCAKPFRTKKRYQYHLSVHTGQYRFKCRVCGEGFNDKPDYDKHLETHYQLQKNK